MGKINLKDLMPENTYFSTDQKIRHDYEKPVGSEKEIEVDKHEMHDSVVRYASGKLDPAIMKRRVLKYKLLGGSLEDLFDVVRSLEPNVQRSVMRDIENFYLEGQKFTRSGWRRNDLREGYGVGALQLKGSDNSIYIEIADDEFIKLGILDKFENSKAEAFIYADEIDKIIDYLKNAKAEVENDVVMKPRTNNLRQGF